MSARQSEMSLFAIELSKELELSIDVAGLPLIGLLSILVFGIAVSKWLLSRSKGSITLDSAEFGFGDSKIVLKPNRADRQIAYSIWVELSTRKIGLSIEPEDDVLVEIYDSWYQFFGVTRELLKQIPADKLQNESTKQIVGLSIQVLNEGLRPHLTKWQARFRHWYERTISVASQGSPQEIQCEFPEFGRLTADMLAVNAKLIMYRAKMFEIIGGETEPKAVAG